MKRVVPVTLRVLQVMKRKTHLQRKELKSMYAQCHIVVLGEEEKSFTCILIYREGGEDDDVKQSENKKYGYPMTKGEIDYRVSSEL